MKIAKRIKNITESVTLALTAKAKELKAQGKDIIGFGAGEPDFDTPDFIKQVAIDDIKKGFTKYTPASGIPELKKAVCQKFKNDNNLEYTPKQILISCGAKHSLYNAVLAVVDDGDEVIIPSPFWLTYPEQVKAAGGKSIFIKAEAKTNYKITPDQLKNAITDKTAAFIFNSPSNPTGAVYSPNEIKTLAEVLEKTDITIISDEIYEKLLYDGEKHISIASVCPKLKNQTIVINGLSKTYSMTGWRLGYAAGPADVIEAMSNLQSHSTSNPVSFTQNAAVTAMTGDQSFIQVMLKAFDERRKYMVEKLNSIPGVVCPIPRGAFYAFADISGVFGKDRDGMPINNSVQFAEWLLEKHGVAVVPGEPFGDDNGIRLSYAMSMEAIKKGLDRIYTALKG